MLPATTIRFDRETHERPDEMTEQPDRPGAVIIKETIARSQYLERKTW